MNASQFFIAVTLWSALPYYGEEQHQTLVQSSLHWNPMLGHAPIRTISVFKRQTSPFEKTFLKFL